MNEVQTRLGRESDVDAILAINKSFFASYSHNESLFREAIAAGRVLIAEHDGAVVAYAIFQVLWGNAPFLALLRVLPEYRGNGLGRTLLDTCEEKLQSEGYTTLVSSSEKDNEEGNAFHVKTGFVAVGIVNMGYGDEVFYRKDL